MRKVFLIGCVLLIASESFSQSFYANRRKMKETLILNFGLNTSTYYGDLKPDKDYFDAKPSISAGATYFFTERFGARAEFSWVTFSGSDADTGEKGKIPRNLSFKSSNLEFATVGIVNLLNHGTYNYQRPRVNVYGFTGVGMLYFNPKAELNGETYALQPLKTEGVDYSKVTLVIPYGVGFRFFVAHSLNLNLEFGWRKTFTDYLDDVSTVHVDNTSFTDPIARALADRRPEIGLPVKAAGSKRGDPSNDDAYMLISLKCEYYLPNFTIFSPDRKLYTKKRKSFRR